ncbi:hypothetical protein [Gemmata massiliana]|uniref:hypothetical protein n=1 Tax=Gemmata massiliana TaxID=1210884 RepID=UPI0013A6CA15|nr:hypothetical protein [Gemmata massiliana]
MARWAMRELFNLTGEYRGAAITVTVLGLAGVLTAVNETEEKQGETHDAGRGRKEGEHARVARERAVHE